MNAFVITEWVSINNLNIKVAVQARNNDYQTNINPTTVFVVVSPNAITGLGSVEALSSCTVEVPSGICSVSVSVPYFWIFDIPSNVENALTVTANFNGITTLPLGSVDAKIEQNCPLTNNLLINAPTYTQYEGSLVYIPVLGHAIEGIDSFSMYFVISSGLEFVRIDSSDYFGFSYVSDSGKHYVTGSTNRFPIPKGTTDDLFTVVLRVSTNQCSNQQITAKVIYLSDSKQQTVSL